MQKGLTFQYHIVKRFLGTIFGPNCVLNLVKIIEKTGADIVVSSSWIYFMSYKDILDMWKHRNIPGFYG